MKSKIVSPLVPLVFAVLAAQHLAAQSCCDDDNTTTLCYLSTFEYCPSNDPYCFSYSLDGDFMQPGLTQKLSNPAHYGQNGTVSCNMELVQLNTPVSVQSIYDQGCDIVFTGSLAYDPVTLSEDATQSYFPAGILDAIYAWSLECDNNLAIISQGETTRWGYTLENDNVNPNTPVLGTSLGSIFDGPFGTINSFFQGGSFQGVFTGTPSTGFEILAKDDLGRPTVALDLATNDLVTGDIGIYCTGPGDVSVGPDIITNNDILTCNIFALACLLADEVYRTNRLVELCPNETTILPSGQIIQYDELGIYSDTLTAFQGCDSIVTTIVIAKQIEDTVLGNKRCDGDGYSVTVNGNVYDQANPSGEEMLLTPGGCDSTVVIALQFNPNSAASISSVLCPGETIQLFDGSLADAPGIYLDSLVNSLGCDSVLTINLSYYHNDTTNLVQVLCPTDSINIGGTYYQAGEQAVLITSNVFGCDSLVITDLLSYPSPGAGIDSVVEVTNSDRTPFSNSIASQYRIKWLESGALSCDTCANPIVLPNEGISPFHLTLTDEVGCRWDYEILANYICNTYLPNVFSPNGDGINDEFIRFSSGCPPQQFELHVFDRWGEEVFYTDNTKQGWDGNFRGEPVTQGVYAYLLIVEEYGEKKQFAGEVILVR